LGGLSALLNIRGDEMSKQSKKHNSKTNNGFDLNNFDVNNLGSILGNMNPNQLAGILNGIDINQLKGMFQGFNSASNQEGERNQIGSSRSIEILNSIKPLVNAERSQLIDSIIQIYTISKIIKK
jgi:hypothetical protein